MLLVFKFIFLPAPLIGACVAANPRKVSALAHITGFGLARRLLASADVIVGARPFYAAATLCCSRVFARGRVTVELSGSGVEVYHRLS